MRKPRKHYAAVEKVAILRRHLLERVPVSDLCDHYKVKYLYRFNQLVQPIHRNCVFSSFCALRFA